MLCTGKFNVILLCVADMRTIFLIPDIKIFSHSLSGDEDGVLCDTISRKTLFYLIATLNAAFPDYDFSMAKVCVVMLLEI